MRQLKITQSITNRESTALEKYLQDISHEGLISVEEEIELARKIKQGDVKALEKLTKLTYALWYLLQNSIKIKAYRFLI